MIDHHLIEPTGEGIIINWRRDSRTGGWIKVPYTVAQAEEALAAWRKCPEGAIRRSLVSDMEAAIALERGS